MQEVATFDIVYGLFLKFLSLDYAIAEDLRLLTRHIIFVRTQD